MTPPSATLRWSALSWPPEVEETDLHAGLRTVAGSRQRPIIVRAEGQAGRVKHLIGAATERVVTTLTAHLTGSRQVAEEPLRLPTGTALRLAFSTRRRAVMSDDPIHASQGLVRALQAASGNERLILEWVLLAAVPPAPVAHGGLQSHHDRWLPALLAAPFHAPDRLDPEVRRALAAKRAQAGWRVVGRLAVAGASEARRRSLLNGVLAALRSVESPGLRLVVKPGALRTLGTAGPFTRRPAVVTVAELISLTGWPVGDVRGLPVNRQASRHLPAVRVLPSWQPERPQRLIGVGRAADGSERALVLPVQDGLRHTWVVGPTGAGKSTLLLRLIEADMIAGRSLVVFDPKTDLLTDVLARVPAQRRADVVVLDPSDAVPVGLNPLAAPGGPEVVVDGLLGSLHELFAAHWGPRTQDILHASLLSLARWPGSSLAMVPLLLSQPAFRSRVIQNLNDPLGLGGFWQWYEGLSEAERQAAIGPVLNKLRQLLLRPTLRAVVGQAKPRFDLAEVFSQRRIVLISLASGTLGPEAAALFGSLAWSRLWQATQARALVPPAQRHPITVYGDEFQTYLRTPVSFTDMLVACRGYGVGLVLAHQHLGQLSTEVREAVLGNVGSRVVFQLLARDAEVVAKLGRGLSPEDLTELGLYEVYASLRLGGHDTGWMSGRTLPPSTPRSNPAEIRAASAQRYGVPRTETEAALRAALEPKPRNEPLGPIGVRQRTGGSR